MAPLIMGKTLIPWLLILSYFSSVDAQCVHPEEYHGDWYSQEKGVDVISVINSNEWQRRIGVKIEVFRCMMRYDHPDIVKQTGGNTTFLMSQTRNDEGTAQCYYCVDVLWRTLNILQVRIGNCLTINSGLDISIEKSCDAVARNRLPDTDNVETMFRESPRIVNCITTFEGVYQYTYEVDEGGGGICNSPDSEIKACQDPGSSYVDNQVFYMTYGKCRDVSTSRFIQKRYQCMGSWFAVKQGRGGYTYTAIADTVEKDNRERFKCLMTKKNQKDAMNQIRWTMSRFPDCKSLNGIYDGPVKLVLTRVPPPNPFMEPHCNLPRNITGKWFSQGIQYKSNVEINETHVYFHTVINEFEYQETYYSCQQTLGTRFLMSKVVVGKCEVDFVCLDFMPRHHSIVRYRVGRPNKLTNEEMADPNYRVKKFREACSWVAFTFNREDYDWKYEFLILDPPSPMPCPIAGRYTFIQNYAKKEEAYSTRIRGVTDKPRVQVDCRQVNPEFQSCSTSMNTIEVDAEYCESVDYRGRPIGEYDVSDHVLMCVGYWMEDMKSYLITWDEEDAISSYRCWVYERLSWTDVVMSRAQNARCPRGQVATDYEREGTGLSLELYENERLFDDCPQRFDPGIDPYKKPTVIYVMNKSSVFQINWLLIVSLLSLICNLHILKL
ncbi:hypothetical protein ScPMuIL_006313 [Solemya velum]